MAAFVPHQLGDLGFTPAELACWRGAFASPKSIVVLTGVTHSGMNTTAYATLLQVAEQGHQAVSIEYVPRCGLRGVDQMVVEDITEIGPQLDHLEKTGGIHLAYVRELFTAEVTRRLFAAHRRRSTRWLTTVHAHLPSAVQRLRSMEAPADHIAEHLTLIQGQRLLPRLCRACRIEAAPPPHVFEAAGLEPPDVVYEPGGCVRCQKTGFLGELLVVEQWPITAELRDAIRKDATAEPLWALSEQMGVQRLRTRALLAAAAGDTTVKHVFLRTPPPTA